ncbi:hypothetical protein [Paenibacillus tuaregi]|uniref:hypothetical protein n=1 Tax=Paenibacillus tuaregi TaxID=1816681 RepID=UPI0008391E4A|nr:hypothetical protein [Paenibacillus tuaregi]
MKRSIRSDVSVPGWGILCAYTRNVSTLMASAAELIAKEEVTRTGVITPKEAFVKPERSFLKHWRRGTSSFMSELMNYRG